MIIDTWPVNTKGNEMREKLNFPEIRTALATYVQVRSAHGYKAPLTPAEIYHSALLHRLLSGKEPLEKPPPHSFSYPWYDLGENGTAISMQVKELTMYTPQRLLVNQSDQYEILERPQPHHFVVRCTANEEVYRVYPEGGELVWFSKLQRWGGRVSWRIMIADRYDDKSFPVDRPIGSESRLAQEMSELMGKLVEREEQWT